MRVNPDASRNSVIDCAGGFVTELIDPRDFLAFGNTNMRRAHPAWPAAACLSALCFLVVYTGTLVLPVSTAQADPPGPKRKDSRAGFQSKNADLTTAVEPSEAKPGDTVTFKVIAKMDPGYHIYRYSKTPMTPGDGPSFTSFDLFDTDGLKVEGDWAASKEPSQHKEAVWPKLPFVEYFEDEVTWSIKLKVPPDTPPGKKTLRVQAGYMICNDKSCSMDGRWTLPPAELTILPTGAAAKQAEPAPKKAAAAPEKTTSNDAAKTPVQPEKPKEAVGTTATPAAPPTAVIASSTPPSSESSSGSSSPDEKPTVSRSTPTGDSSSTGSSEIANLARQGLIPFLIASALGGLFALVMPCVWPMVPITVNFFVKQGQGKGGRKKATGLAIIYCLSIIGIFTAVGVLCSFFFSAATLPRLANNPWLNLAVAGLFILFGLSLLGLFEIRLPSFLLNASSKGEGRGGLVGVVFMALTLTITSFTCTFPVVGGLLVMAAGGSFFYPIVGLATFATVLALPFFLLALSPNLISKMPRSGDWMNAVKVVGGLIEIGAALKFMNTAELAFVTPDNAWFNARLILTSWVVLSLVCGLYLLGMFRTDHDHDDVKVGPGRLVTGAMFLVLALYLMPALFGHLPQGRIWDRLVVGLLPPDAIELGASAQLAGNGESGTGKVKATSSDPAQAEREQKSFHGVTWGMSLEQAREQAAKDNRPILIDFTGQNCSNCRLMEAGVFPQPEVVSLLKKFVPVQLYTDFPPIDSITADQRLDLGDKNKDRLQELAHVVTNPMYVILSPTGEVLGAEGGYIETPSFVDFLSKALKKVPQDGSTKVAQSGSTPETAGKQATRDQ
jgi:thiol:disulfide interchange protein